MNHEKALYIKIADDIIFDINAETLKPNSILPLQSEYARAYNTSLGTVKKAYALLKKRGLIKTVKGHGTIVRGAIKSLDFATDSFRDTIAAGSGIAETRVIAACRPILQNSVGPPCQPAGNLLSTDLYPQ